MAKNFFKDTNLGQAWLVLLMALVFGALLALVQLNLAPKIAANIQTETYSAVPALVLGNNATGAKVSETSITAANGTNYPVYLVKQDDKVKGFGVKGSIIGYADTIEILVGLNADVSEVTGIFVLYQKETPGLGDKIKGVWNEQFIGKTTSAPLAVNSDEPATNIDALSGATISSKAVTDIVNAVISDLKQELLKLKGE